MKKLIASTLLTGAIGLTVAHAAPILIDFGTNAPSATAWTKGLPSGGGAQNVSVGTYNVNITKTGFVGGWYIQPDSANAAWATGTFNGNDGTALNEMEQTLGLTKNSIDSSIFLDSIGNGGQSGHTLTLSGLTAGDLYTVYFIVGNNRTGSDQGVQAVAAAYQGTGFTSQYYLNNAATAEYQTGVANVPAGNLGLYKFTNVLADVDGKFKVAMSGRADINAMAVIPEPATLGIVVAFGGGLLFIRRKLMM